MSDNAGIRMFARIIRGLSASSVGNVQAFTAKSGVARSTAFDVVARLEAADFIRRDRRGNIAVGPRAIEFGLSRHCLTSLQGRAEAILDWLADQTSGLASLRFKDVELMARGKPVSGEEMSVPVSGHLYLVLCAENSGSAQDEQSIKMLKKAAAAIAKYAQP